MSGDLAAYLRQQLDAANARVEGLEASLRVSQQLVAHQRDDLAVLTAKATALLAALPRTHDTSGEPWAEHLAALRTFVEGVPRS